MPPAARIKEELKALPRSLGDILRYRCVRESSLVLCETAERRSRNGPSHYLTR